MKNQLQNSMAILVLAAVFSACGSTNQGLPDASNGYHDASDTDADASATDPDASVTDPDASNGNNNASCIVLGPREMQSTDVSLGTKFASPTGTGDGSIDNPYSIVDAFDSLVAGDVLFLRGGVYNDIPEESLRITGKSGTESQPIIIESYPGELAILDGNNRTPQDVIDGTHDTYLGFYLNEVEYIHIRKIEVMGMWGQGIFLKGRYCIIEGCKVHDNFLSGIQVINREFYTTPYVDGWNIIRDNETYNNSDADIPDDNSHGDGDHADGIAISNGQFNIAHNNLMYGNADEGIDVWRSNDTEVFCNVAHSNGRGTNGSGIGYKLGGNLDPDSTNGLRAYAHHNISYDNNNAGFAQNAGKDIILNNNVAWNNGHWGFVVGEEGVLLQDNIAVDNASGPSLYPTHESRINNSWNIGGTVEFISTNPTDSDFLRPIEGGLHEGIGVYVGSVWP